MEVLAFLRGPLRYAERLVGHDAALRSLARWRVWLYDCLTPRVPAALSGWRSGDLLTRAIDDVDTLQDLYLRTLLPLVIGLASTALGIVVVGVVLPVGALALGIPLVVACTVPPLVVWRRTGGDEAAALGGALSAHVVDAIHGAPELLAFGADVAMLDRLETMSRRADGLERRQARAGALATLLTQLCLAAALVAVSAVAVSAVHAHHLDPVMVAVLPSGRARHLRADWRHRRRGGTVDGRCGAAARRLLALEAVPVTGDRSPVGRPSPSPAPPRSASPRRRCAMHPSFPAPSTRSRYGWRREHGSPSPVRAGRESRAWSARSSASGPSREGT